MKFSPYSLGHAPVGLPIWPAILEDMGYPQHARAAKVFGVSVRTARRWNHLVLE